VLKNFGQIEVFWDVTPCQLKSSYQCFGAESSSAASLTLYQLAGLHFPEDFSWNIHQHHCENPTSRIVDYLVFVMKMHFVFRLYNPSGFRPAQLSLSILSRKVLQSAVASSMSNPQLGGEPGI
jgi:hypothetical protein